MNYKSTVFSFLFFLSALACNAITPPPTAPNQAANTNAPSMVDDQGNPILPPGMSEEDMKAFAEFIESLDPETIEALTAIGEEIIKEANELEMDPFEYILLQEKLQQEHDEQAHKEAEEIKKALTETKQPTKTIISIESQSIQDLLKNIIRVIVSIRQKAATDSYFAQELAPFKYRLDDLVYYFTILSQEKMVKYMGDAEFEPLIENLKKFYKQIVELEELFVVMEFSLEGDNPYDTLDISRSASQQEIVKAYNALIKNTDPEEVALKFIREGKPEKEMNEAILKARSRFELLNQAYAHLRAKEESIVIFNRILDAISQAIDVNKIIDESKKIIQKYEPDALKDKQEQEKLEAEARKKQEEYLKKRPIITRSLAMPPARKPSSSYKKDSYDYFGNDYGGSFGPSGKTKSPDKSMLPKPGTPSKGKPGSKDDKKKDDKNKKKGADKKDGAKGGAPSKGPEKKDEKKPLSADIAEAIGGLKGQFRTIGDVFKANDITKDKETGSIFNFLKTPFSSDAPTRDKEEKDAAALMTDVASKFTQIEGSIKRTNKKFDKDKEKLKSFKEAAIQVIKDFEKSDQGRALYPLLSTDNKGVYTFDEKTPGIYTLPEKKDPKKDTPQTQKPSVLVPVIPEKRTFILQAPIAPAGQKPNVPYIKLMRDAYKAIKEKVGLKSGEKATPAYVHAGPPPGPTPAPEEAPETTPPPADEDEA